MRYNLTGHTGHGIKILIVSGLKIIMTGGRIEKIADSLQWSAVSKSESPVSKPPSTQTLSTIPCYEACTYRMPVDMDKKPAGSEYIEYY
jgi:hypothetical protein